jgi:2-phosphosulfolactate phosphatase
MRVHVALTPADASGLALEGRTALVVDVLRATTSVVAACTAGCVRVIPVADACAARERARQFRPDEILLAGERGGEPIAGFHLGNSPLEFTADRVRGKTILLTTTNGTVAMLGAASASAAAVAALTNVSAVAGWALAHGRDLVVLCSGDDGAFSIEDAVCAGLVVARLSATGADLSDGAVAALGLGRHYAARLGDLKQASRWARRLVRMGLSADVDACLRQDVTDMVPVLEAGAVVPAARDLGVGLAPLTALPGEQARDAMKAGLPDHPSGGRLGSGATPLSEGLAR